MEVRLPDLKLVPPGGRLLRKTRDDRGLREDPPLQEESDLVQQVRCVCVGE